MRRVFSFFFVFSLSSIVPVLVYSQTPPPSQTIGGIQAQEDQERKDQDLEKQITSKKKNIEEPVVNEQSAVIEGSEKSFIKEIDVRGVTLVPQDLIDEIVKVYEGRELSINDMQKVCDLITDEYRKRGRVTSRAYMPPQTISAKDGVLLIIVIEGRIGIITVNGNRYFSTTLIKRKLRMKPGEYFDYKALQRALVKLNDHPDRFVKAGLIPGKDPGTTDIVLEVQDRIPLHAGEEIDNFGSRYMHYLRDSITVEDNNVTGNDDKLFFKYQRSLGQYYSAPYVSYTIPITDKLEGGAYWLWSDTKLGKQYKSLDVKGESSVGGPFFNYELINKDALSLKLTGGYDYKSSVNYVSGVETSRDEDRVVKAGLNLDTTDKFGRTVATIEEDVGVLGGGLYTKDPLATTPGGGAQFEKLIGSVYRLQPMPFSSSLLWKNSAQYSNYDLLSIEQFQLGGISNVRGYAPATYAGDRGLSSTLEWSFPPYFMPKDIIVPHSKATFYDATRFVVFYDMGYADLRDPTGIESPSKTLQGWGFGVRFNLPEDFFARVEYAYPIEPRDVSSSGNLYWDFGKKF